MFWFSRIPKDYSFPEISNGQLYKQAGNSVSVPVIKRISENIMTVLKGGKCPENNLLF